MPLQNKQNIPILVKVMPGNTVSQLIAKYYDTSLGTKTYKVAMAQFKRHNPNVKDISHIRTGQILKLMPIPAEAEISRVEIPTAFDPWTLPNDSRRFEQRACGHVDRIVHAHSNNVSACSQMIVTTLI